MTFCFFALWHWNIRRGTLPVFRHAKLYRNNEFEHSGLRLVGICWNISNKSHAKCSQDTPNVEEKSMTWGSNMVQYGPIILRPLCPLAASCHSTLQARQTPDAQVLERIRICQDVGCPMMFQTKNEGSIQIRLRGICLKNIRNNSKY